MTTRYDLEQAYFHNIQHNQVGEASGISPDVAADIGFATYDDTLQIIEDFETGQKEEIHSVLGGTAAKETTVVYCGDGCGIIPCQHTNGLGRTRGN